MTDSIKKLNLQDLFKTGYRYVPRVLSVSFHERENDNLLHVNLGNGAYMKIPIDISEDVEIGVEDRSEFYKSEPNGEKTYWKLKAELEHKKTKAEFDAEIYNLEELDGKTWLGEKETKEQRDKIIKYYEMRDVAYKTETEIFNLKKDQSLKIPLEVHQAAFEIKKEIIKKLKELKELELSGFTDALEFQGITLHDQHERNWCSSSAECNHVLYPHEDITDKLK